MVLKLGCANGEIGNSILGRCRLHRAGDIRPAAGALQSSPAGGGGNQFGKMTARRGSRHPEAIGIDAVLGGVSAQIADSAFAIFNVGAERRVAAEPLGYDRNPVCCQYCMGLGSGLTCNPGC